MDHGSPHLLCICDHRVKQRLMGNHLVATERKTHFSYLRVHLKNSDLKTAEIFPPEEEFLLLCYTV